MTYVVRGGGRTRWTKTMEVPDNSAASNCLEIGMC